jgi:hypothetical protein
MSDTPDTQEAVIASNGQWSFILKDTCERLERERNEAADMVAKLTIQGLTLMDANRMLKKKARKYKKAIIECLQNNRHLADGEDCTLIKLKKVIYDDKKNN